MLQKQETDYSTLSSSVVYIKKTWVLCLEDVYIGIRIYWKRESKFLNQYIGFCFAAESIYSLLTLESVYMARFAATYEVISMPTCGIFLY